MLIYFYNPSIYAGMRVIIFAIGLLVGLFIGLSSGRYEAVSHRQTGIYIIDTWTGSADWMMMHTRRSVDETSE